VLAAAWYRLATSWRPMASGYLALILVVSLGGGLALGSVAAARRTASSYSVFLASTNPSDVTIEPAGGGPIDLALDRHLVDTIRRFPHVRHVESYVALGGSFRRPGARSFANLQSSVLLVGSVDGMLFDQDRFTVTQGHRADPTNPRQVMVTETAAQVLRVHVGQSLGISVDPNGGIRQGHLLAVTVTGIGILNHDVVQDQIERFPTYVIATPALTRSVFDVSQLAYFGVQLDGGSREVPAVERRWNSTEHYFTDFQVAAQTAQEADQSIRPEALALGVFGCIAGLTTAVIALEEMARQRRGRARDLRTMRALGASPAMAVADALLGSAGAVVLGGLLAAGVAIALSPLAPIGPARQVYPDRGFSADWAVIGPGCMALVGVLVIAALVGALLAAPHRGVARQARVGSPGLANAALHLGLPPSTAMGARFALGARHGQDRGTTQWVLVGAVTALLVVSATLTFGSSLQHLVSEPSLYGWNWDYAVQSSDGYGPVPQQTVQALVRHDHKVVESGVWFATLQLDGVEVPTLLATPGAPVAPPLVSGHAVDGKNQIVLGAATLAQLHKRVGDTVRMRFVPTLPPRPIPLRIVGVATMPAIGIAEGLHSSMGTGAVVAADNGRVTESLGPQGYPGCNGPNMVFVRATDPSAPATAQRAAQQLATSASRVLAGEPASTSCGGYQATVLSVQRPAQIVDYRSMGLTPLVLAIALAAGATIALGLTLMASVRWRRHELAILKAMGFTPRQLRSSVLWQAGIVAAVGIIVGVPLGVAAGRSLWTLFAQEIGVVPAPIVPFGPLTIAATLALALALGLSAVPATIAARTPAVTVLAPE
jgi:putative ABC transport system permease protein